MEDLKNEILNSKKELQQSIQTSEDNITLKIETILNEKIRKLERENSELKEKIEQLERNSKSNNIVIFGLPVEENQISAERVRNKLNSLLGININKQDINNIYKIGKTDKSPIKVEFISTLSKITVLQNKKKLKGTKISIVPDLTKLQLERNKILSRHLKDIRSTSSDNCYIKGETLIRNNIPYTVEDILAIEKTQANSTLQKVGSQSQTPSKVNSTVFETQVIQNPSVIAINNLEKSGEEQRKGPLDEKKQKEEELKDRAKDRNPGTHQLRDRKPSLRSHNKA